ncbi:MAG: CHAT domain-containing protein [Chloracidobacterium sp.]|nr:CHAT domain-containing protein [Chloracidobacterium sp.]
MTRAKCIAAKGWSVFRGQCWDPGSSSVVSSQWEASDRATQKFSGIFYRELLKGSSTALSLQTATKELINDKSSGFHEPYFWASFTLLGDYR